MSAGEKQFRSAADAVATEATAASAAAMTTFFIAIPPSVRDVRNIANEAARKQAVIPTAQFCQESAEMLKLASTFDGKAFHDYALAHAVNGTHPTCSR